MVHLSTVQNDSELKPALVEGMERVHLEHPAEDETSESVYGSRFASEGLPAGAMPDGEMPKDVAYRLIKDHLSLDGNPMLNLASFVTTYMEKEAEMLMQESLSKNFIDYEEYPQTADIQAKCVNMIARLYNIPTHDDAEGNAMGTSTVGSSEVHRLFPIFVLKRLTTCPRPSCSPPSP